MSIKDQIPYDVKRWYAVKCKYRCEKRLMQELLLTGINSYVPVQKKVKQYASRVKRSEVALIPSHIFVSIDRSEYLEVLNHPHIYQFLNFSGIISSIPDSEMDLMKRVVGDVDDVSIVETDYLIGDTVQIISGELTGLTGALIEEKNHNFKIELTSLGWGMMIYVDPKHLIKIGSSKKVA